MEEPGSFIVSLVICAARALTSPGLTHGTGAEVRHRLAVILGLAVCAVLAGACSFTAIAEWAADADAETLTRLGVTRRVPSESTFRRTLQLRVPRISSVAVTSSVALFAVGRDDHRSCA